MPQRRTDRLLIVGLKNPLDSSPEAALEPFTPNGAGERLWKMVDAIKPMEKDSYFDKIDFVNVTRDVARVKAMIIVDKRRAVVLGREAWALLGFEPKVNFFTRRGSAYLIPHPSGRTLSYNSAKTRRRAGMLIVGLM